MTYDLKGLCRQGIATATLGEIIDRKSRIIN
jgi:hypothetical protein